MDAPPPASDHGTVFMLGAGIRNRYAELGVDFVNVAGVHGAHGVLVDVGLVDKPVPTRSASPPASR